MLRLLSALGRDGEWAIILAAAAIATVVIVGQPALRAGGAPGVLAPQDEIARLAWCLVGIPVALYAYAWLPATLTSIVPDIRDGALYDATDDTADGVLAAGEHDLERAVGDGRWLVAGALVTAAYVGVELPGLGAAMPAAQRVQRILEILLAAPLAFLGTVLVLRLVVGLGATRRLLRRLPARVHPLHADEAGGWSPLGDRAWVMVRIAVTYGLVAVVINVASLLGGRNPLASPVSVATLAGFVLLPPVVLSAWLFAPHRAMSSARARVIEPISDTFAVAAAAPIPGPSDTEAKGLISGSTDYLGELGRRRDVVAAAYPAWPLRLRELRAVWATAFAPLLAGGLAIVLDSVRRLLGL